MTGCVVLYLIVPILLLSFAVVTDGSSCGIGQCSNSTLCCPGERQCCSGLDLCCGEHCCRHGYECCHGSPRCCKSTSKCCGDSLCCPDNANCCPNKKHCCPAGFTCCDETIGCCPSNHHCCGQYCCEVGSYCCPNGTGCYKDGYQCCGNGLSCPLGAQCCGAECCGPGLKCCGTQCCKEDTECCEDGCCQVTRPKAKPSTKSVITTIRVTTNVPISAPKSNRTKLMSTPTPTFVEVTSSWSVPVPEEKGRKVDWDEFSSWGYFLLIPVGFVVVFVIMIICCILDKHKQTLEKLKSVAMKHIKGKPTDKILDRF